MALDFHRLDNHELLFGLNDEDYGHLAEIFGAFTQWTGLNIGPYEDVELTTENQKTLIRIIDKYVAATDLNRNKPKTAAILAFRGLLIFFVRHHIDLRLLGD